MHIRTPFLQIQKTETETLTRLHPSLIQLIASLDNRKQLATVSTQDKLPTVRLLTVHSPFYKVAIDKQE